MNYYPDRIADDDYDDEISSCCSAEVEGGVAAVDPRTPNSSVALHHATRDEDQQPSAVGGSAHDNGSDGSALLVSSDREQDSKGECHAEEEALNFSHHTGHNTSQTASIRTTNDQEDQKHNPMAALIKNERNRRLGVRENADANNKNTPLPLPRSSSEIPAASNPGGVLGNIRGWFGGGGAGIHANQNGSQKPPTSASRRSSAPIIQAQNNSYLNRNASFQHEHRGSDHLPAESQLAKNISYNEEDEDSSSSSSDESSSDDSDYSSSQSSNASNSQRHGDADLTPQERARARAVRYLSNSCVDAGRKAKTASYVRGLERLDLKRKRDRYEKELDVVEAEMNKDRGLINDGEKDAISAMASKLVRELPRIQGADAGAGSDLGRGLVANESFMSYDEYADALNNDNSNFNDGTQQQPSLWENKEAVDVYVTSLHGRLKKALERTRALEKRLVVLEQAGDDIVSSLCEDLTEVTGHSNKAEARYVKKGKELQRKRRREELRHRGNIKQTERRVRTLEERLLVVSGVRKLEEQLLIGPQHIFDGSDSSNGDSSLGGDDEDDEILLEKKLSTIKAKNEQDKDQHGSEVDSIRRQCEQVKLRLSVARLVMEGDDNLREYIALLERLNPSTRHHKNGTSDDFNDQDFSGIHRDAIPSPPPSRITRARAKLLKVTHLERIYEQRLAVSKAFTDATINALDQELLDREDASQEMEVRCLNELVSIDSGIKDIVKEASDKLADLESEAHDLEDAIAACSAQKSIASINGIFGGNAISTESSKPATETAIPMENGSFSDRSLGEKDNGMQQLESGLTTDAHSAHVENDILDESEPSKPATEEAIPKGNESSSDSSIDDKCNGKQQVETDEIPNADSAHVEIDISDESKLPNPTTGETISMDKELYSERSIDGKKNDEEHADTDLISDSDSLQIENDIVDKSSLSDTQSSCDSMVKLPLSAYVIAADSIETTPCENTVSINQGIKSSDEVMEICDHDDKKSDDLFPNDMEDGSILPPQNEDVVKTENHFEGIETDIKNIDDIGVSSSDEQEGQTQFKPHAEANDELLATKPSSVVNDENDKNLAATAAHMSKDCKDRKNEIASELHDATVDRELPSHHMHENGAEKVEKLNTVDPEKNAVVEMLGRELKCTLAEYQTSFDLSSSRDRVEQLGYMNDLVLKMAKVRGMECHNNGSSGEIQLKSWSLKKSHHRSSEKERNEKKHSKKKKERRRRGKERKEKKKDGLVITLDGPDSHDHSLVW
mmetsp:Transcript_23915/g.51650  ORF Transcript_23915/g.51650 Transcript_23915/m.51650 type:complete len:1248 (+) Transcript_23915:48-3791(+)